MTTEEPAYEGIRPAEELPEGVEPFDVGMGALGAAEAPPGAIPCHTCFLVVLGENGAFAELDMSKDYVANRPPTPNDIAAACHQVYGDFTALKVAAQVVNGMMQVQQQIAQAQQNQQLLSGLNLQGPPGGAPNRAARRRG